MWKAQQLQERERGYLEKEKKWISGRRYGSSVLEKIATTKKQKNSILSFYLFFFFFFFHLPRYLNPRWGDKKKTQIPPSFPSFPPAPHPFPNSKKRNHKRAPRPLTKTRSRDLGGLGKSVGGFLGGKIGGEWENGGMERVWFESTPEKENQNA